MVKKGKKGKKGKKLEGPEIITTLTILTARDKMLCPRMGDTRAMHVEHILEGVVTKTIQKCIDKQQDVLHLANMRLNSLPVELSNGVQLQSITDINLSKNQLFKGDTVFQILAQLGSLKRLNLAENFLNGALSPVAGELTNLEELRLDHNHLTELPASVQGWTNIRVLTLTDNRIPALPAESSAWVRLQHLNLRANLLTELPSSVLACWSDLERLYLGSNKIRVLPDEIALCSCLREIDMSNNVLEALPVGLSNCTKLEQLHLGANKIADIPPEVLFALTNLRELQLYKNRISVVPPEIGNLSEMYRLSLSSNNIKALPEEIGACTQLKELYVNNNAKLATIPSTAGHLRFLQELSLRKCPALKSLPVTVVDDLTPIYFTTSAMEMTSLRELDLRAAKKQVCKITPEVADSLRDQFCVVRGGVVKKAKGGKKPKKK